MAGLPPSRALRLLSLGGIAALAATTAIPQDSGGVLLTFGIDQRLEWIDNPGLKVPSEGDRLRADTRLSFGFASETPLDRLTLNASAVLRAEDGGSGSGGTGLQSPSVDLGYTRTGVSSALSASAFLRERDLAETLTLLPGDDDDPPVFILDDGTERTTGARLSYSFGLDRRFGGTLRASVTETDFQGTSDPDLVDNHLQTAGVLLRFGLNEVTDATIDLGHRRFDETGPTPAEDSTTISLGLTRALPRGSLWGKISQTRDEDGDRASFSLGHSIELPAGMVSAELGLTESNGGDTGLTGALAWRQDLPRGAFSLRLSRAVSYDSANDEALVTALSLALTQELTPRIGLNLAAVWNRSEETASGLETDSTSLQAGLNYALTEDWGLNFGASHRVKDGAVKADSSSVFLSLGRTFEWRP